MAPDSWSAVVAALALLVSIGSVVYLAIQTRIGNAVAGVSANETVLGALREVHVLMLERPGSRAYFYDSKACPAQGREREQILTIAELLADVLNAGIVAHRRIPLSESKQPWEDFCRSVLRTSPVLRELLVANPTWWPDLPALAPPQPPPSPVDVAGVECESGERVQDAS